MENRMEISLYGTSQKVVATTPAGAMEFEIRELDADSRDSYMDLLGQRIDIGTDGQPHRIKKVSGMHTELLELCLYREGKRVPASEIGKWPSSVVSVLFTAAQKINKLSKSEEELVAEAKND
jgi:hypothetical protein